MKFFLIRFFLIMGFLVNFHLAATEYYPKNDLSVLGKSVESVGLGGAIFSADVDDETAMDNVALSGGFLRSVLSLNMAAYYSSGYSVDAAYFHPTSLGVFSGKFHNFNDDSLNDVFTSLSFGFGKEVVEGLLFGFGVNLHFFNFNLQGERDVIDDFTAGITGDINVVYQPKVDFSSNFFVFKNLILGAGIRNVGFVPRRPLQTLILREDDFFDSTVGVRRRVITELMENTLSLQQMDFFRVGFGFDFIGFNFPAENGSWASRLLIDAALIFPPFRENINLGWKNSFNFKEIVLEEFYVSVGYFHNPNLGADLPISLGTGFNFFFDKIEFDVNYALVLATEPRGLFHKVGIDIKFGELDDTAPDIDTSSFSEKGVIEEGTISD